MITARQEVTVTDADATVLSIDATNNAGGVVLRGDDLQALAEDPKRKRSPAPPPGGGAIFIDGFSGGQFSPKESIREVRINQNPFPPEYHKQPSPAQINFTPASATTMAMMCGTRAILMPPTRPRFSSTNLKTASAAG
jgi:hypothetical protein